MFVHLSTAAPVVIINGLWWRKHNSSRFEIFSVMKMFSNCGPDTKKKNNHIVVTQYFFMILLKRNLIDVLKLGPNPCVHWLNAVKKYPLASQFVSNVKVLLQTRVFSSGGERQRLPPGQRHQPGSLQLQNQRHSNSQ